MADKKAHKWTCAIQDCSIPERAKETNLKWFRYVNNLHLLKKDFALTVFVI
jgi:hypothetical protein